MRERFDLAELHRRQSDAERAIADTQRDAARLRERVEEPPERGAAHGFQLVFVVGFTAGNLGLWVKRIDHIGAAFGQQFQVFACSRDAGIGNWGIADLTLCVPPVSVNDRILIEKLPTPLSIRDQKVEWCTRDIFYRVGC